MARRLLSLLVVCLLPLVSLAAPECEVCVANLEAIDKLLDSDEKTSKESIISAIDKHCKLFERRS